VRRKGETGKIRTVASPGKNTTANALLMRYFPEVEEVKQMLFSDIAAAVERGDVDAGVLIHEGRFVYERRNLELVADLGKLWESETNLPLPLGAIIVKRDIDENTISLFDKTLSKSIRFAFENPILSRDFVKEHAQELEDDVIEKHISLFVNDYTLSLGEEGRRAVERLLDAKIKE
jgi:1,4-dihydroxy-6-naphthoate synthase